MRCSLLALGALQEILAYIERARGHWSDVRNATVSFCPRCCTVKKRPEGPVISSPRANGRTTIDFFEIVDVCLSYETCGRERIRVSHDHKNLLFVGPNPLVTLAEWIPFGTNNLILLDPKSSTCARTCSSKTPGYFERNNRARAPVGRTRRLSR